tara:strand:- start:7124 stop:7387 length:264 start_codon:yes stop_codon:yes gene_type:complete
MKKSDSGPSVVSNLKRVVCVLNEGRQWDITMINGDDMDDPLTMRDLGVLQRQLRVSWRLHHFEMISKYRKREALVTELKKKKEPVNG